MILQMLAPPPLLILAGFATFAGDRARVLLRQELAAGVRPAALIAGRLGGLAAIVALVLLLVTVIGGAALAIAGAPAVTYAALGWMLLGYGLYLFAFAAPTLSGPAAEALVTKKVLEGPSGHDPRDARLEGPSGHDPRDARLEWLKAATKKRYGVTKMEDLPVDFGGISLFHGEALSTAIYRRHFAALLAGRLPNTERANMGSWCQIIRTRSYARSTCTSRRWKTTPMFV